MSKIKVLICWHWDPLASYPGGIGRVIEDMIHYAPDNFEFTIFTNTSKKIEKNKIIKHVIRDKKCILIPVMTGKRLQKFFIPLRLKYMYAIKNFIKKNPINNYVIHFHGIEPWFGLPKDSKNKKVLFIHKNPSYRWEEKSESYWRFLPKFVYTFFEKKVLSDTDSVFFVNSYAYKEYCRKYSLIKNKFHLISTWVDTNIFYPRYDDNLFKDIEEIRSKNNIPKNSKLLFYFGRYDEIKNPLLLIKSIDIIRNKYPETYLLMVGGGDLENEMRNLIVKLSLKKNVSILDYKDREFIRELLWASDLSVLPSKKEGMSMAINESLGCGCPLVGFNVGEIERVVVPGTSGEIVYGDHSPENYAHSLIKVLDNLLYYKKNKKNIVKCIGNFTPWRVLEKVYKNTESLFNQLIREFK